MANTLEEQKAEEKFYFDYFTKFYPESFVEKDRQDEIEVEGINLKPDFLIDLNGKRIGVELTELNYEHIREDYEFKNRLIELAKMDYNMKVGKSGIEIINSPKGMLMFFMESDIKEMLKEKNISKRHFASRLASFVLTEFTESKEDESTDEQLIKHGLENYINEITFFGDPESPGLFWSPHVQMFRSGSLLSPNIIEKMKEVVLDKERKIETYLKKCSECWLLIHSTGSNYSPVNLRGDLEQVENTYKEIFDNSAFSKIFFLNSLKMVNLK